VSFFEAFGERYIQMESKRRQKLNIRFGRGAVPMEEDL
jgi:hypothetical protein